MKSELEIQERVDSLITLINRAWMQDRYADLYAAQCKLRTLYWVLEEDI